MGHSQTVWLRLSRFALAVGLGLVLGACAVIERAESEEARKEVSERARQRWDLVAKGQIEKAYEFLSPASRSTVSLDVYRKRAGGGRWWRSMTLDNVDCRTAGALVRLSDFAANRLLVPPSGGSVGVCRG